MKNLVLIALSTLAVSAHAWEPDIYIGANGAFMQYHNDHTPSNFTLNMVEGVAGLRLIEYVAVEARGGFGFNTARDTYYELVDTGTVDTDGNAIFTENAIPGEVELGGYGSFYFKPMLENEKATLYGLLGYTIADVQHADSTAIWFDDAESDLSYGFGVSFKLWEKAELTAEWRKLINAEDFDIRGGSIGFLYTF